MLVPERTGTTGTNYKFDLGRVHVHATIDPPAINPQNAEVKTATSPRTGRFEKIVAFFTNLFKGAKVAPSGEQSAREVIGAQAVQQKSSSSTKMIKVEALFPHYNNTDKDFRGRLKSTTTSVVNRLRNQAIREIQRAHLEKVNSLRIEHQGDPQKFNEKIKHINQFVKEINKKLEDPLLKATALYDNISVTSTVLGEMGPKGELIGVDRSIPDSQVVERGIKTVITEIQNALIGTLDLPADWDCCPIPTVDQVKAHFHLAPEALIKVEQRDQCIKEQLDKNIITEAYVNNIIEEDRSNLVQIYIDKGMPAKEAAEEGKKFFKQQRKAYDYQIGLSRSDIKAHGYGQKLNPGLIKNEKLLSNYHPIFNILTEENRKRNKALQELKNDYNSLIQAINTECGPNVSARNEMILSLNQLITEINDDFDEKDIANAHEDTTRTKRTIITVEENLTKGSVIPHEEQKTKEQTGFIEWTTQSRTRLEQKADEFRDKYKLPLKRTLEL